MYWTQEDNRIKIGNFYASDLAKKYQTPVFITDQKRLEENFKRLHDAFNSRTKTEIVYACKANTNLSILKILEKMGANIDAVSPGEIIAALRAGFPKDRIMFTGPNPSDDDLDFIVESGVKINIDSLTMLEKVAKRLEEKDQKPFLSFRVNPNVPAGHHEHCITAGKESKFGLPTSMIVSAYKRAKELGLGDYLKGIHCHIGSGILDTEPFYLMVDTMCKIATLVEQDAGINLEVIDIGGGYGIPYKPGESELDIDTVAESIVKRFKSRFPNKTLAIEPGRYLVADTTVLLTTVNTVKETPEKTYVGIDAGFNTLARTVLYGSYHHILHSDKIEGEEVKQYDVAGPLCESGDIFVKDYSLPEVKEGEVLALLDAGAYGFTMSSNYNSRVLAAEVLVDEDKHGLIRKRQDIEALFRDQVMPEWV